MFIIVQDLINERERGEELFECFDILAEPSGMPLKFESEGDSIGFLQAIGMNEENPILDFEFDRGVIRVDRLQ